MAHLMDFIKKISIYKSSGTKYSFFLKDVMLYLPQVILHLYNLTISSGIFPDSWKIARVIPLPECISLNDPSELRPISLYQ